MPENNSNRDNIALEIILADEYKTALIKYHYLNGFGPCTIFDEIADINDEKDPKIQSNQYDPNFGDFYFASLGSAEANMIAFGMNSSSDHSILFFTLRTYVNDIVNQQLLELPKGSSSLRGESRFIDAWFDEMMRASIRGLNKAGCTITGLPLQYSGQVPVVSDALPSSSYLEQKVDSLEKKIDGKIELSAVYSSRFRKYLLASIAGLYLIAAAACIGSVAFVQNAKKQLREKEIELEQKLDDKIADVRYNFNSDLESNIWNIVGNALNNYAPDTGVGLSPQERLPIVLKALEENKKTELLETIKTEVGEINFLKLMQLPAGRSGKKE